MNHLKAGMIFTTIGVYSNFILQIIINAVLSRLLTPQDYGVVAIMQVFIVFFAMMIESGMGPAIIQNKKLSQEDVRVLFNFSAIFAVSIAVIFGLFGYFLAWLYHQDIYKSLTWVQAISVLFNGLNIVPSAILNKSKKFKHVNFSMIFANVCAGIIGVSLAFLGLGVYSLIISAIVFSIINFLLNLYFTKLRFSSKFYMEPLRSIWTFSKNQFGFNFINYFSRNTDNILVGKFMGEAALANYGKAYQLLMLPNSLFLGVITPVLQPVLSDYQDDVVYIREVYYKVVHVLALIGVPLSVFLSLSADKIILFMFGSQWGEAVIPFSILALTVWIQMTLSSSGAIFQARNQSKVLFVTGFISAIILVTSISIGVAMGSIVSVAICLSIGFLLNFIVSFYRLITITLQGNMFSFLKVFISPLLLGVIMFIALKVVQFIEPSAVFLNLIVRGITFLFVIVVYIWSTTEKIVIKQILEKN